MVCKIEMECMVDGSRFLAVQRRRKEQIENAALNQKIQIVSGDAIFSNARYSNKKDTVHYLRTLDFELRASFVLCVLRSPY